MKIKMFSCWKQEYLYENIMSKEDIQKEYEEIKKEYNEYLVSKGKDNGNDKDGEDSEDEDSKYDFPTEEDVPDLIFNLLNLDDDDITHKLHELLSSEDTRSLLTKNIKLISLSIRLDDAFKFGYLNIIEWFHENGYDFYYSDYMDMAIFSGLSALVAFGCQPTINEQDGLVQYYKGFNYALENNHNHIIDWFKINKDESYIRYPKMN